MKHGATPSEPEQQDDHDVWAWIVIGATYGVVAVVLFAPLVWRTLS